MSQYHSDVEYHEERMLDAIEVENKFTEFFRMNSARVKKALNDTRVKKWNSPEFELFNS